MCVKLVSHSEGRTKI